MKKLYTTILAALCVFGASALEADEVFNTQCAKFTKKSVESTDVVVGQERTLSLLRASMNDYVGEYEWSYKDGSANPCTGVVNIEQGDQSNVLKVTLVTATSIQFTVNATYNALMGTITLPKTQIGTYTSDGAAMYFMGVVITDDKMVEATITGTYDAETASISFGNVIFAVTADEYLSEGRGSFFSQVNKFLPPSSWEDLGVGKFKDGFIGMIYGAAPAEVDVQISQNANNPGMFRVMNPYLELVGGAGSVLEIDATDPEYVLVPQQTTGIQDQDDGEVYVMGRSYAWANLISNKLDKAAFISTYPQFNMTYDKAAGRITMPANSFYVRWPKATGDGQTSIGPNGLYPNAQSVESYLQLPGLGAIGNVAVDAAETNAPVEYFNLQGMKVAAPEAGQVVIRRQGSKVSKILVK